MKRSTLILLTLLPALLRAVDSSQVLMEEPGRTNRSALAYLESLSTTPYFATTGFVRTTTATNAYFSVSSTLYPYMAGRMDRFTTNWSYIMRPGGGFNVDNFHVNNTLTVRDLDWTAGDVTSRLTMSEDVSGFAVVAADTAELRGEESSVTGVDAGMSMFRDVHLSQVRGLDSIDTGAVYFRVAPVMSGVWRSTYVTMPPGAHEVAAARSVKTSPDGVNPLQLTAVVPSYADYFRAWHLYESDTEGVVFLRLHMEPAVGHLYRLGMQIAVTPGETLTPGVFQYSLLCYGDTVLTHKVTTGPGGIPVESGPAFAVVDSFDAVARSGSGWGIYRDARLLCFTIEGPAAVAGEPFFYRVWLDRLTGMETITP